VIKETPQPFFSANRRPGLATGGVRQGGIARAARDDHTAALACYDRERRRLGEWIVARGRQMGASIKTRKKMANPRPRGGSSMTAAKWSCAMISPWRPMSRICRPAAQEDDRLPAALYSIGTKIDRRI